ncbi:hypothetical protein FN846DRAFT_508504 [Sphaerosporella brunnea]|uniref:Ubiquitin-protein ligase Sel1/Ubx2 n=1 Tax=Sphaerosporella brunnea TaxID=1250544 RepID=A0A5J5F4M9_9PEZI|nr:hypothetical protein FN846DRAFT_508504 [Sphaerosporella brunnea]
MRWTITTTPRYLVLLALLVVSTIATASIEPKPAAATALEEPSVRNAEQARQAAQWVSEARTLLHSINPVPHVSSSERGRGGSGWLGTLWYYIKQLLLWHNAQSLEQQSSSPSLSRSTPTFAGAHGKKLGAAVELLKKAAEPERNEDAMFLLAEMNFYGNWSHPRDYSTAYKWYKELADLSGNSTAQHMVGFMHATGIGGAVPKDQGKALLYHTFAALGGNTRSEMTIAFRHYQGIGTSRNCEEAAFYYRRVAEKALTWWESGPPGGHFLQKHTFRLADDQGGVYGEGASAISSGPNGQRQRQSLDSAKELGDIVEYLELLARKGNFPETISLGKIYYEGSRNLPRNIAKAKEYFLRVANQYWDRDKVRTGGPQYLGKYAGRAAGYLGNMALRGEAGPQDYNAAFRWFKRGVTCGDANSQNGLGFMYLNGLGVKEDREKASKYFKSAASQDFPVAQVNFAKMLLENGEIEPAKRYLELAARHGNVEAFYYLAEINNAAKAKDRSCGLATAYYKIVAEKVEPLQSPMAWANQAYENGDMENALVGYMMAAEQGYESAQANVAYLLDEHSSALPLKSLLARAGIDLKRIQGRRHVSQQDQELALIYWTRSAKQANVDSLVKMGDYYLSGIGTDPDPVKAASCYNAAAEHQASAQALWNLGWMHENGVGVSQDFHLAKRYYDQAFETNPEAYLPVTLSLLKLRLRAFWNIITHGGVKGIGPEPKKKRVTFREFLRNWYEAATEADLHVLQDDEEMDGSQQHLPGDEYYDEGFDEDVAESIIILALAGAVAVLVYYRQWRQQQQARRRAEERLNDGARGQQAPPPQPPPPVGIWNDPQMPGWGMPH